MGELVYLDALRRGKKEQKKCLLLGRFPYLPVLDEILTQQNILTEQNLGLVQIPLDHVVGTSTKGRTYAFAANFMPILDEQSEFACKWEALAQAQVNEGIRDPIKVYEFMNRFYVVEGNKRVSVLKFFGADRIAANVVRKIPAPSEDLDIKLYYEFMKFNEATGLNTIEFTRLGYAEKLLDHVGAEIPWDEKTREEFRSVHFRFTKAYEQHGGNYLPIHVGDALTCFIKVYGYDKVLEMSHQDFSSYVSKCWSEFVVLTEKNRVDLVLAPKEVTERKSLFKYLMPSSTKKFTVAFLYPKSTEESNWTYAHDLGRIYLEETFPDQISTICVDHVDKDNIEEVLFYFSGHGITKDNEFYYCTNNTFEEKINSSSLINKNIDVIIKQLNPKLYIKIIDACESGTAYIKGIPEREQILSKEKGNFNSCYFFSSSQSNQKSYTKTNYSEFTYQIITILKNRLDNGINDIKYRDLSNELSDAFMDKNQKPYFVFQGGLSEIFLTFNKEMKDIIKDIELEITDTIDNIPNISATKMNEQIAIEYKNSVLNTLENKLKRSTNTIKRHLYHLERNSSVELDEIISRNKICYWLMENKEKSFVFAHTKKTKRLKSDNSHLFILTSRDYEYVEDDYEVNVDKDNYILSFEYYSDKVAFPKFKCQIVCLYSLTKLYLFYGFGVSIPNSWSTYESYKADGKIKYKFKEKMNSPTCIIVE